jgi:hypothetical protein
VAIGIISVTLMGFFGLAGGTVVIPGLMYLAGLEYQHENCRHHRCSDVHNGMDQFAPGRENQRRLPSTGIRHSRHNDGDIYKRIAYKARQGVPLPPYLNFLRFP